MQYEGRIFRPPSEARSLIVQATIGCSHNECTFCDMYKEKRFRMRKTEDVIADLSECAREYGFVRRIFLADGDALILKTEEMLKILRHIQQVFPGVERVAVYGSPKSVLIKSVEQLKELRENGLGMVYMGLESGSDEVLRRVNKGETCAQIVEAGKMIKQAGIPLSVTAISGLGGTELWEEHALRTAEAFSEMKPDYIGLLTLMFEGDVPLLEECRAGRFELLTPEQVAQETLLMLRHMDCEGSVFRSNHASNYLSLKGTLNRDKEAMIRKLEEALSGNAAFKKEYMRGL
ncbi:MAG: radical SAM protein [Christensenellales bacterium]|jgi:radical SAM superfamily enzyme YgiQ (UPF0313 family)